MLASARTRENRGKGRLAALAPQSSQDGGEGRIAVIAHEQADWDDDLTPAAGEFKPALQANR